QQTILRKTLTQQQHNVDVLRDELCRQALAEASLWSSSEEVISAYRVALKGNIEDENDPACQRARDMLRKAFASRLRGQKQWLSEVYKLHFHLPDGHSLVRLWRDGWQVRRDGKKLDVSDDVSSFRKMIIECNEKKKGLMGIEIGRAGLVLRGIVPVRDETGKHLGSVEMILPFQKLLQVWSGDKATGLTADRVGVFMQKRYLTVATRLNDPARFPVLGNYVLVTHNLGKKDPAFLKSLFPAQQFPQTIQNKTVFLELGNALLMLVPIHDYSGKVIGFWAINRDLSDYKKNLETILATLDHNMKRLVRWMMLGGAIVLGGIIWYLIWRLKVMTQLLKHARERIVALGEGCFSSAGDIEHHRLPNNELGDLLRALHDGGECLRERMALVARIARGDLSIDVSLKSERDELGQSL
ncbi:MAG: hypothetical protein D6820_16455, partial [Lentisphaerae bacterium]